MSSDTAIDAYWRFFAAFNSRDPEAFSAALNYPHVRVSSRGTPTVVPTLADHARAMSWERVLASGWHHTEGHEPSILHEAADRAHIVGGWTRVDADGNSVLKNRVVYIVTHTEAGWGIQSRFGVDGGDAEGAGETDAQHAHAVALVESYVDAYNRRDWAACAEHMATPHFKVDVGMVRRWPNRDEVKRAFEDGPWHFVTEISARAAQGGGASVSVALDGLLDGGDQRVNALFFVSNKNGWGIEARSIIENAPA